MVLFGLSEGVGEVVRVFAVGDDDVHGAGEASELAGAGVGHDDSCERGNAAIHGGVMLQNEGAGAAVKSAANTLNSDIPGRTLDNGARREHFAFACGFKVAVKLFVDRHASQRIIVGSKGGLQRSEFDFERAGGVLRDGRVLL